MDDIFDFTQVKDPQLSPDRQQIAFTVTKPSLKDNSYHTNIWMYDRKEEDL